ncbi:alpha/beta hydrolase [Streptomyces virginiae]|uniref:alpha/beta hydrolase n=1 Tax=Streptomyces virginiae TaxID=1961 RepID=UPI0036A8FD78
MRKSPRSRSQDIGGPPGRPGSQRSAPRRGRLCRYGCLTELYVTIGCSRSSRQRGGPTTGRPGRQRRGRGWRPGAAAPGTTTGPPRCRDGRFATEDRAVRQLPCAFWQRPLEPATPMKTRADVLTVQNEWEPMTPLATGQGLHRALKGSRMVLALGGEGHGVYLSDPTACADQPVNAYLSTGRLPAKDATCHNPPPTPDPEGGKAR